MPRHRLQQRMRTQTQARRLDVCLKRGRKVGSSSRNGVSTTSSESHSNLQHDVLAYVKKLQHQIRKLERYYRMVHRKNNSGNIVVFS